MPGYISIYITMLAYVIFVSTCNIIMFHLDVYVFVLTIYTLNRNNDDKTCLTFKHLARPFRYILSLDKTLN